jgi:DNA-binding CsgD family transcriptional regulator
MIGRGRELRHLRDVLRETLDGIPRAVVVAGEAGIGKTRLLTEFQAEAAASARILVGQCVDLGSAGIPYAPIISVLRSLVQQAGADAVLSAAGPGGGALTLLLPELSDGPTDRAAGVGRLHEMVAVLLETFARDQPIVVVIEDLHWVDGASLTVLQFLLNAVTAGRVMLVLSYRSDDVGRGHPLRSFLSGAERARLLSRIELRRLSRQEVRAQAREILGTTPDADTIASVFERSEGVPFFVEELVDRDCVGLPDTLRDILLARYERLENSAQQLLRILSAGGMTVSHRLLAAVYERSAPGRNAQDLDVAVRDAMSANVLLAGPDNYSFRHALVREAIHADLLPGERGRFHTWFAEALEASGDRASAEVAQHWFAAGNPARAFPTALAAMDDARRSYAYASAAQLGERALSLWGQIPHPEQSAGMSRVDLLAKTASALRNAGDGERSLAMVNVAIAECEDRTGVTFARLLRDKAYYLGNVGRAGSIPLLEQALELVPPGLDEHLRGTLLNTLAGRLMTDADLERAIEVAEEALTLALSIGSPSQASIAANLAGMCKAQRGQLAEGLAQLDSARSLAEGDPGAMLRYRVNASDLRFHLGQYERALALAEKGMVRARELGVERVSGVVLASNAVDPLIALGRWDRADEVIERMLALAPPAAFRMYLQRAKLWLLLWRGNSDIAFAQYREWRPSMDSAGMIEIQSLLASAGVIAEIFLERGEVQRAWDQVAAALEDPRLPIPGHTLPLLAVAARVLARRRDVGAAPQEEVDAAELRLRERLELLRYWPTWPIWAGQVEAELATESQVDGWSRALEAATDGPANLRAYSLLRLGQAQVESGDRPDGRESLRAAVAEAAELGSGLIVDRAVAVADRAGLLLDDEHPARTATSLELTPRERQVLGLIEQGLSNRQIGEQLFISAKTASVHVSAILRKLGAATRTEAAFVASQLSVR